MRVLSIDLPWSSASATFGFAWIDLSIATCAVETEVQRGAAAHAAQVFAAFALRRGRFDVVLVDQPIATGAAGTGHRGVERAFGNSAFLTNAGCVIQAPRFQPGAPHVMRGLANANAATSCLGGPDAVVVESFPQLSVLPLIAHALAARIPVNAVSRLAAHKAGANSTTAARQLISAFSAWTGRRVCGPATSGNPDGVDALLALLPALEILDSSPGAARQSVWLHSSPPAAPPHPSSVRPSSRAAARPRWMSPIAPAQLGATGIRTDGILSLRQPGWPLPSAPERFL